MPRLRLLLITALSLIALKSFADQAPTMQSIPTQVSIDYLSVSMPDGQSNMGLLGLHYDAQLLPIKNFFTGIGLYNAITGNQGGFFALGIDNSYRKQIFGPLYANAGLYVGGGGSARSQKIGGGLMLMPYAGLAFELKKILLTLNYSYVTFPGGQIHSSQILFGFVLPLNFDYFNDNDANFKRWSYQNFNLENNAHNDHLFFTPMLQTYHPKSGNTDLNGNTQTSNIGLVGAEVGKYFSSHFYVALRSMAAANGNMNGYMNVMVGPGYELPLGTSPFSWVSDLMMGAGGGGNAATGGGWLTELDTGLAWRITYAFEPRLMVGYLTYPDGSFRTWVGSLGFTYNFALLNAGRPSTSLFNNTYEIRPWRINLTNQTLFNPERTGGSGNINFINLGLDQLLTPSIYLSYRAAFPYAGDNGNGGSIVDGLIGAGYQFSQYKLQPYAAFLVGAIGGGGIDAGGGFVVQPEVGLRYALTSALGLNVSAGRMMSARGSLNSTVLNAGVSLSFGEAQKIN